MSEDLMVDLKFEQAMDWLAREEALLMKPSKVLHAAADLLEKGWCQGALGRCGVETYGDVVTAGEFMAGATIDQLCLMGALMKAVVDLYGTDWPGSEMLVTPWKDRTPVERAMTTTYLNTEKEVEREIRQRTGLAPTDNIALVVWNDAGIRTQAEVVDVVRVAAAREEEAGR